MAVQGSERKFNICDRCFASVPVKEAFCSECGAPIVTEEHGAEQSSDAVVYTELARANLLRMRGEYKQAEDQCLNILKRFPNNASANTLLGDIAAEQNDLTQAVQWYELSLDLVSDDPAVKNKLNGVQERIKVQEAASTAKELGIPNNSSKRTQYVAVTLVLFLIVALAGFVFGEKQASKPDRGPNLSPTVKAPAPNDKGHDDSPGSSEGTDLKVVQTIPSDLPLLHRLQSATPDGSKVLGVMQDPRTKAVTVIYEGDPADFRPLGARLAQSLLAVDQDALNVTVRAMHGGSLLYTADVLRSRLSESSTESWKNQNPTDAWIDFVLMNEWYSPSAKKNPSEGEASGASGTDTSGDTGKESTLPAEKAEKPSSTITVNTKEGQPQPDKGG